MIFIPCYCVDCELSFFVEVSCPKCKNDNVNFPGKGKSMTANEQVKLSIITEKTEYKCICSYAKAKDIIEALKDPSVLWVEWSGRVNDVDSNQNEFCVRRDLIISADFMVANNL